MTKNDDKFNLMSFTIYWRVYARLVDCNSISAGAYIFSRLALTFLALLSCLDTLANLGPQVQDGYRGKPAQSSI
jgi:hypothetical protein